MKIALNRSPPTDPTETKLNRYPRNPSRKASSRRKRSPRAAPASTTARTSARRHKTPPPSADEQRPVLRAARELLILLCRYAGQQPRDDSQGQSEFQKNGEILLQGQSRIARAARRRSLTLTRVIGNVRFLRGPNRADHDTVSRSFRREGWVDGVPVFWGVSSVGRALEWHSRGQGFEPPILHCGFAAVEQEIERK